MHTVLCMMTFQDAHCTSHPIHYRCKVNIFHEKLDTTDSIIATLYFTHHVFVSHFNSWVPQTASEQVSGRCHNLKPVTQVAKLWRVLNLFYLHFQQWYYHYSLTAEYLTKQTIVSVYLLLSGSKCLTMGDVIPPFYKFSG